MQGSQGSLVARVVAAREHGLLPGPGVRSQEPGSAVLVQNPFGLQVWNLLQTALLREFLERIREHCEHVTQLKQRPRPKSAMYLYKTSARRSLIRKSGKMYMPRIMADGWPSAAFHASNRKFCLQTPDLKAASLFLWKVLSKKRPLQKKSTSHHVNAPGFVDLIDLLFQSSTRSTARSRLNSSLAMAYLLPQIAGHAPAS